MTVPAIAVFAALRRVNATVPGCTASLNVAVTGPAVRTSVAPTAGEVDVTVGGVVSRMVSVKTTSTQ